MSEVEYGTPANPVPLDPFQVVTEVHWNVERYIAFPLSILRRSVIKDYPFPEHAIGETGVTAQPVDWTSDEEPSPGAGGVANGNNYYVTGFQYEYDTPPAPGYFGYAKQTGGGWTAKAIDSFSGVPSLPDVRTVTAWTVAFGVFGTSETVLSWWPRAEYQPITGDPLAGLSVPIDSSVPFVAAGPVTLQMRGWSFTGGPLAGDVAETARTPYLEFNRNAKYGTINPINLSTEEGIDHTFEPLDISVADIHITRHGRTYAAIGMAVTGAGGSAPTSPGTLWVLCERQP